MSGIRPNLAESAAESVCDARRGARPAAKASESRVVAMKLRAWWVDSVGIVGSGLGAEKSDSVGAV